MPLTFLTGMMVGNEAGLTVMDWDRFAERWREPDGADDGDRFTVSGLEGLEDNTAEVALAEAVSYPSDADGIRTTLGDKGPILGARCNAYIFAASGTDGEKGTRCNTYVSGRAPKRSKTIRRRNLRKWAALTKVEKVYI